VLGPHKPYFWRLKLADGFFRHDLAFLLADQQLVALMHFYSVLNHRNTLPPLPQPSLCPARGRGPRSVSRRASERARTWPERWRRAVLPILRFPLYDARPRAANRSVSALPAPHLVGAPGGCAHRGAGAGHAGVASVHPSVLRAQQRGGDADIDSPRAGSLGDAAGPAVHDTGPRLLFAPQYERCRQHSRLRRGGRRVHTKFRACPSIKTTINHVRGLVVEQIMIKPMHFFIVIFTFSVINLTLTEKLSAANWDVTELM